MDGKFGSVAILEREEELVGPSSWKIPRSHFGGLSACFARAFFSWAMAKGIRYSILIILKQKQNLFLAPISGLALKFYNT